MARRLKSMDAGMFASASDGGWRVSALTRRRPAGICTSNCEISSTENLFLTYLLRVW